MIPEGSQFSNNTKKSNILPSATDLFKLILDGPKILPSTPIRLIGPLKNLARASSRLDLLGLVCTQPIGTPHLEALLLGITGIVRAYSANISPSWEHCLKAQF